MSFDLRKVRHIHSQRFLAALQFKTYLFLCTVQHFHCLTQILYWADFKPGSVRRQPCFPAVFLRKINFLCLAGKRTNHRQNSPHCKNPSVKPQFPDKRLLRNRFSFYDSFRGKKPGCDGKIVMTSLFVYPRRRKIDRYPASRIRKSAVQDGASHPVCSLFHRRIAKPRHMECRQPSARINLRIDCHSLYSQQRRCFGCKKHIRPPC